MKKHHLAALVPAIAGVATVPGTAPADTLLGFDFEDIDGAFELTPETAAPGIVSTEWFDLDDTLTDYTGNPGRALGARGFDDGNAFILIVEIAPGTRLELAEFAFDQRASGSGASAVDLIVDDLPMTSAATTTEFTRISSDLTGTVLTDIAFIEIAGTGATSGAGTFRLDNVTLTGIATPVPLPAPVGAFTAALGCLAASSRTSRQSRAAGAGRSPGAHSRQTPRNGKYSPSRIGRSSSLRTTEA